MKLSTAVMGLLGLLFQKTVSQNYGYIFVADVELQGDLGPDIYPFFSILLWQTMEK